MPYIITNPFALECMEEEKLTKWTKITVEELQVYMGFMILMGVMKLPSVRDYWKRDAIYHYEPVASRISRDPFE